MDYVICIPSHNRSDVINNKTLKMLRHYKIDLTRVYVFVVGGQIPLYHKAITSKELNLVEGRLGIKENRKCISDYFPEDTPIVCLDDDIKWICKLHHCRGGKQRLDKIECFESLIFDMFDDLDKENAGLGGLYPISNPFFMKNHKSTDLKFIIGNCKFFYNKKKLERRRFELLEDYETTLNYYLHFDKIIRYNNFCVIANYRPLKWNKTQSDKNKEVLLFRQKYPEFSSINFKANGNTDIRLDKNPKRVVLSTLWINDKLPELNKLCISSWIKQGYNVDIYTNLNKQFFNDIDHSEYINIKNPNNICIYENNDILPYSDYWRYNLLLKVKDAIWIDSDMFLLDRLPNYETLISTEHTFQSGAMKSDLPFVPNIGVLKFSTFLGREFLSEVIEKIDCKKETSKFCDNMLIFRKTLKKQKYSSLFQYTFEPKVFCPIPWWNCKQIYKDIKYPTKYSVNHYNNENIFNNSIGVHLWNNFTNNKYKIDFKSIKKDSLYDQLKIYINSKNGS